MFTSSFPNLFCLSVGVCVAPSAPPCCMTAWMKPEWQIAWLQSPKILAFTEAIARKYVHLRAQAEGGGRSSLTSCAHCSVSLTLVSFPEAATFAWLDQADLGLSRRTGPSPPNGSSASHATCCNRGAAAGRTMRVPAEPTHSPTGSGDKRRGTPRLNADKTLKFTLYHDIVWFLCSLSHGSGLV